MTTSSRSVDSATRAMAVGLLLSTCAPAPAAEPPGDQSNKALPPAAEQVDFARQVAPLLTARCLRCHGPKEPENGFRLETREHLLKGGYSGAAIEPGRGAQSRLLRLVADADDTGLVMPPEGEPLTAAEIGLLRAWIDRGAPWPDGLALGENGATGRDARRPLPWAFQPVRRPAVPAVRRLDWPRNPIDCFVLRQLESEHISPAPEAERATLARRVAFDLIGLPLSLEETAAFLADERQDAYERLVDRLLASPHYGEKWARHWLDLCHYADTDGYLTDQPRPVAWRYRQWLIDALNGDLPFDQFTVQQLAGDLLPDATIDERIATGFLRNTLSNREGGADLEEYRVEQVIDRTMMVGTIWLGLTVGCARCHDHKYDPISQREFYQLYACFDSADEVNIDAPLSGEREIYQAEWPDYERRRRELLGPFQEAIDELETRWEEKLLHAADHPAADALWDRQWEVLGLVWGGRLGEGQLEGTQIVRLDRSLRSRDEQNRLLDYFLEGGHGALVDADKFAAAKLGGLGGQLKALNATRPRMTRAPVMREGRQPRVAHVHVRGDFRRPGVAVEAGVPAALPPLKSAEPRSRLTLARWLVAPENPLTARVAVNRAWQEFFGRGLVPSPDDFGARSGPATHPELLDWLAAEFRRGWSVKALHRLIATSAVYRQSSRARDELRSRDPHNDLLARQAALRLSADQIRDAALTAGGLLNRRLGGPSVFPPQPDSVAKEGFENEWVASVGGDRYRRGLYTYLQRLSPFAQQVTFDAPASGRVCARRERSDTPLQALTLLNDAVFFEAARALAARTVREASADVAGRIAHTCRLALGRPPTPGETRRLASYLDEQRARFEREGGAEAALNDALLENVAAEERAAWTCLASVLLNLHEFITRD